MEYEVRQELRGSLDAVEAAFLDPAFVQELGKLPKLGRIELLDQHATGDQVHRRVRYTFGGEVSAAVKAVVDPARLTWVEESTIDRATHVTTFRIVPDFYARLLEASGTIRLRQGRLSEGTDNTTTIRDIAGNVTVHVPLVGRKVEQVIVSDLKDNVALQGQLIERWVASHR
jgi:hypothetical protein